MFFRRRDDQFDSDSDNNGIVAERPSVPNSDDAELFDSEPVDSTHKMMRLSVLSVVILAVAGVGWYIYDRQQSRGGATRDVQIIKMDPKPTKSKPDDPGGMVITNMDKSVYDAISRSGSESSPKVDVLLPQPETPMDRSQIKHGEELARDVATDNDFVTENTPTDIPHEPQRVELTTAPSDVSVNDFESKPPTSIPNRVAVSPKIEEVQELAKPEPTPTNPAKAKMPKLTQPVKSKAAPTTKGKITVQLASVRSQGDAEATWQAIRKKHNDLLSGLEHFVVRKDLGPKGIYFRLQTGPLKSSTEARALCKKLIAQGQNCFISQ
jgi:cell division septation protein DedD